MRWLPLSAVLAAHEAMLAEYGGANGVRDQGALESALARPRQLATYGDAPDIFDLAAAYAFGVARNHPFVDGNKRTAWACARAFLILNDHGATYETNAAIAIMLAVANGGVSEKECAEWLRKEA